MTNPESDVLSAIDALERDEIGELVTWQIREGRKRERQFSDCFGPVGDPSRPQPSGPYVLPSGRWWRCDSPGNLCVQVEHTRDVSGLIEWRILVEEQVVAHYRFTLGDNMPHPVEYEIDDTRHPVWLAILCETPPLAGEWRLWERAALVPVS